MISDVKQPARDDDGGELRGEQTGKRDVRQKRLDETRHGDFPPVVVRAETSRKR